jgi:hypothetical protein
MAPAAGGEDGDRELAVGRDVDAVDVLDLAIRRVWGRVTAVW